MTASPDRRATARRCGSVALACTLPLVVAPAAAAQRFTPTLDVGGAQVTYADSVQASSVTLSPSLAFESDHATFGASGSYSRMASGWSTQGALQLTLYTPAAGLLVGELTAQSGGSAHQDGARTGQSLAVGRGHLMGANRGLWVGAGAGAAWDGAGWRAVRLAELAGWARAGRATLLGSVTPRQVADTIRYTDAEAALQFRVAPVEVGLSTGFRAGDALASLHDGRKMWGSVAATMWVTPRLAIVASGGAYPVDFTQNYPGGRYVSLALRVGARPARLERSGSTPALDAESTESFRVRTLQGSRRLLQVHAPGARTVELMGDFTNWAPVSLTRGEAGWWSVTLPIPAGTHELNVRLDGGEWIVPAGLHALSDEFGGRSGLLTIR